MAGKKQRIPAEQDTQQNEPAAEAADSQEIVGVDPDLEKLRREAEDAQRRLDEATEAARDDAPVARTQERRSATSEHSSRVDELEEERATHQEAVMPWVRPSSLEAPPPREGMTQRWIRISTRGVDDPRNLNRSTREGWSPRPMDSVPMGFVAQTGSPGEEAGGHFIVDDLMLCEMPTEIYLQRKAYYENLTAEAMEAVEADLDDVQQQTGGPRIQRTRRTRVTNPPRVVGRQVEPADDV